MRGVRAVPKCRFPCVASGVRVCGKAGAPQNGTQISAQSFFLIRVIRCAAGMAMGAVRVATRQVASINQCRGEMSQTHNSQIFQKKENTVSTVTTAAER